MNTSLMRLAVDQTRGKIIPKSINEKVLKLKAKGIPTAQIATRMNLTRAAVSRIVFRAKGAKKGGGQDEIL